MNWHPLRLTTPIKSHAFGGRAIVERLGRSPAPSGRIAETSEVSDVDGEIARVENGPLAGRTLRSLATGHPEELMGRGWRGDRFPVLTKFIDASGPLPVHLHADDADAQRLEAAPHGKTEAWHILDAPPGATALAGVHPGVDAATLRDALVRGDFDAVMRRLPARPGETLYVPAGTLHSFGPVHVGAGGPPERLEPARTLLLPAALRETRIDGPADVLIGYLPDLEADVRAPLAAAGHGPQAIAGLDG